MVLVLNSNLSSECIHIRIDALVTPNTHSASFARCLELRDKYMELSNQRLGDNPRDHDGSFNGFFPRSSGDIMGLKADVDVQTCEDPSSSSAAGSKDTPQLKPWNIYPPPPPPQWHWKPAEDGIKPESSGGNKLQGLGEPGRSSGGRDSHAFNIEECEIPGESSTPCQFGFNSEGVYEVWYEDISANPAEAAPTSNDSTTCNGTRGGKDKQPLSRVPSLKEYFTDLDFLLGVCSDGPAKSFAFRRLKYLASKWSLYCLLNEYQELADMKVSDGTLGCDEFD